jgi:hypothetical protein
MIIREGIAEMRRAFPWYFGFAVIGATLAVVLAMFDPSITASAP